MKRAFRWRYARWGFGLAFGPRGRRHGARGSRRRSRRACSAATGELRLENTNGAVRLTAWDEPRVKIQAVKHAGTERALEELKVEIVGEGDRLSVRTRYPRPHWMGNAGRVDYRVSVPRGAAWASAT